MNLYSTILVNDAIEWCDIIAEIILWWYMFKLRYKNFVFNEVELIDF